MKLISYADLIHVSWIVVTNAASEGVLRTTMERFGYDAARLEQGRALVERLEALRAMQARASGERVGATDTLQAQRAQVQRTYMEHLQVARLALRDDIGALAALGAFGSRDRALNGWLGQAQQFYINALQSPQILERLAGLGLTDAQLRETRAQIQRVIDASAAQQAARGAALATTAACQQAARELRLWISQYQTLARRALRDDPQVLEQIRIVAPSAS